MIADHLSRPNQPISTEWSLPRDRETYFQALGDTRSQHVCNSVKLPPFSVHVSNSGATSPTGGCSVSGLAGEVNVHVSPIPPAQQSHSEAPVHPGEVFLVAPWWPKQSWFSTLTSLCGSPLCALPTVKIFCPSRIRSMSQTESRTICTHGGHYKAAGFSDEVSRLAPKRPSTNRMYDDRWLRFAPWAAGQGFDPLDPTAAQIAPFLFTLFDTQGLSSQTVKGYRTCLGSVLNRTGKAKVVMHQTISDMIVSMELQRPRVTPVFPQWDLGIVLEALSKPPCEPLREASFKLLTLTTVFLLAMASAGKCSELQALRFKLYTVPT